MSVSAIVLICLAALLCGAALAVLVASHLSSRQKALLYEAQERVDELEKLLSVCCFRVFFGYYAI